MTAAAAAAAAAAVADATCIVSLMDLLMFRLQILGLVLNLWRVPSMHSLNHRSCTLGLPFLPVQGPVAVESAGGTAGSFGTTGVISNRCDTAEATSGCILH